MILKQFQMVTDVFDELKTKVYTLIIFTDDDRTEIREQGQNETLMMFTYKGEVLLPDQTQIGKISLLGSNWVFTSALEGLMDQRIEEKVDSIYDLEVTVFKTYLTWLQRQDFKKGLKICDEIIENLKNK